METNKQWKAGQIVTLNLPNVKLICRIKKYDYKEHLYRGMCYNCILFNYSMYCGCMKYCCRNNPKMPYRHYYQLLKKIKNED